MPTSGPSQEPVRPYSRDSAASCEHHLRYNAEGVPRYPWIPGLCLLADPAFLARLQSLDVLAMSVEQQQRQHRRQCSECGLAEPQRGPRGDERGHQGRERGIAGGEGGRQPEQAEHYRRRPEQPEHDADIDGDTLAAFEFEPDREEMAEEGAKSGQHRGIGTGDVARDHHRHGALERVEQQGCGGKALAPRAQHVGGADAAGADRANILRAAEFRQDQSERNRAEQVSDDESHRQEQFKRHVCKFPVCKFPGCSSARQTCSYTVRPPTMVRTTRPVKRASSNGVFLQGDLRSAGSTTQGTSGSITMTSAGLPGRRVPPGNPKISAGRVDIARISVSRSSSSLCTRRRPAGSMVSSPMAPGAASAKGRRLTSTSCGLWSDMMTSTRPEAMAATSARRSSSVRSGGDSFRNER